MKLSGSGHAEGLIGSQMAAMVHSLRVAKCQRFPHHIHRGLFAERRFARNDRSANLGGQ